MKKQIITAVIVLICVISNAQTAEDYYNKGMEKAQNGELKKAIALLGKSIELNDKEFVAWYNRGMAKAMLDRNEEAIEDYNQTIVLNPGYKKVYLNRGTSKKRLADYEGALKDYNMAIKLDSIYPDAYYNRGLLYQMLNKNDLACADFNKSLDFGIKQAEEKVEDCNDTTKIETFVILELTKKSEDKTYGFSEKNPVKVGKGPNGGPANQRAYLNLLRDAQGKPLKYERLGSCCPYESVNGFFGSAMLDQYEITYKDIKGKKKKAVIYISFYDYESPKILVGFNTIK